MIEYFKLIWFDLGSPAIAMDGFVEEINSLPVSLSGEALAAAPAFCDKNDPNYCVKNPDGKTVVRAGLYCCWGTSCD